MIYAAPCFLGFILLELRLWKVPGWFFNAMAIFMLLWGLVPALVYNFELGIHQCFHHLALAHMLIIVYLVIMYTGGRETALHKAD